MTKISLSHIIQIILFLFFVVIALGMVFSRGICCADDASSAVIAKNFAGGFGYSSTTQEDRVKYSFNIFDPRKGTGPVIILPTAILIKLVGNTYWAPGLFMVCLWSLLLLLIGRFANKLCGNKTNVTIATFFFFFLSYIFTTYHYEQWYALLGEIPVAFSIILAILIIFDGDSKTNLFISGALFSLAVYTKFIAIIAFATFILIFAYYHSDSPFTNLKKTIKTTSLKIFYVCLGFFTIVLVFEMWKTISMYLAGESIIEYWGNYILFLIGKGVRSEASGLPELYSLRINTILERFGIFLPGLVFVFISVGLLLRYDKKLIRLFSVFIGIITIYSVYWIFFSIGWARHYIIPLILIIFVLVLPFFVANIPRRWLLAYSFFLIILTSYSWHKADFPFTRLDGKLFRPTTNTQSLIKVGEILSSYTDDRPFITQWWATATDIEYIMKTHLNFTTHLDPDINMDDPYIFAINTRFLSEEDEKFLDIINNCSDVQSIGQYLIGKCDTDPLK